MERSLSGFRGHSGRQRFRRNICGVRLFDDPIRWNPNPDGNNLLLVIEIPEDAITEDEWIKNWEEAREFFVPSWLAKLYGPPAVKEVELLGGLLDRIDLSGIRYRCIPRYTRSDNRPPTTR
ncbi:MAG: hypothetical protein VX505_00465 [Chloroflexota bacterium]|nr:hypothetical protein [Chloroflexota bacterium]